MSEAVAEQALGLGEGIAYGLIQGLTEFLPVSSSGHLAIAHLLGLGALPERSELSFDVLLHGATLIAIVVAFRREILAVADLRSRRWLWILIAVIPAGVAGLLGGDLVDAAGESWGLMAACYVYTALLLIISEQLSQRRQARMAQAEERAADDARARVAHGRLGLWPAVAVGVLQVPALLPGVSRSGSTVAAGLLVGLPPALAVSFSFLVGLPLIAGATAKKALDGGFGELVELVGWPVLSAAFLASLASGFVAIVLLKLVAQAGKLRWFAAYCLLVAAVCLWQALNAAPTAGG